MSIIRTVHNKENPYFMLNRSALNDNKLSWAAKGIWAFLLSKPDHWEVSIAHLASVYSGEKRGNGEEAIRRAINELIDNGYMIRQRKRDKTGLLSNVDYTVHETQLKEFQPQPVKPDVAKPDLVKPAQENNESLESSEASYEASNNPLPPKGDLLSFGKFVKISQEDLEKLQSEHGLELIHTIIDEMNDYLSYTDRKPYKDYAAAIRSWIRKRKANPKVVKDSYVEQVKKRFNSHQVYNGAICNWDNEGIGFSRGMNQLQVSFKAAGFKEQFENILRKFGIPVQDQKFSA